MANRYFKQMVNRFFFLMFHILSLLRKCKLKYEVPSRPSQNGQHHANDKYLTVCEEGGALASCWPECKLM